MAENIPNLPGGALPPKKETGKVQPKKETVRINLPPKPSAAPTIKLPTVPPGGPVAAGTTATPAPTVGTMHTAPPPPAALGRALATPGTAQRPAPPSRPAPPPQGAPTVSTLDNILAIAAAVIGLAVVGSVLYLMSLK
jgi:hypothetical protein